MSPYDYVLGGQEGHEGLGIVWEGEEGREKWTVKLDVKDIRVHLDTTIRSRSATLAARVRLVMSRLVLVFSLPLDLHRRMRVVRTMFIPGALHGIEASLPASSTCVSYAPPSPRLSGLVVSLWPVLGPC